MAKTEILGIGNLKANFAKVKLDMQSRTARGMVVAAGGVLKRKAKAIAQANGSVRTGAMVKNIAIKREPNAGTGIEQYNLGVRSGADLTRKQKKAGKQLVVKSNGRIGVKYLNNPFYWKWVEQGHNITGREPVADGVTVYETTLRNGKKAMRKKAYKGSGIRARRRTPAGEVGAKPFIGPALAQGKEAPIDAMAERLNKALEKAGQ